MIIDKIENLSRYQHLHSGIQIADSALAKGLPADKKFSLQDDLVWGLNLSYKLRIESEPLWEAHRKHLDFHMTMDADERIDLVDISKATPTCEYDDAGDYQLFNAEKLQTIILRKGYFMLLFPNEVHRVGIITETPFEKEIAKVVLKFKI